MFSLSPCMEKKCWFLQLLLWSSKEVFKRQKEVERGFEILSAVIDMVSHKILEIQVPSAHLKIVHAKYHSRY